jgi:succinoglycan biosynthesis transport protein ExoP
LVPPTMPMAMPPTQPMEPMPPMPQPAAAFQPPAFQAPRAPHAPLAPMSVASIEQIAAQLREAGDAGRRVAVIGTERNVGTTYAAITLARMLAESANVVLLDLAFVAPNVAVISTEPDAPGVAELIRGEASFGDIITRDQYSRLHLVATGNVGPDGPALAASPMLATVVEALVRNYDHVVIDAGSAADNAVERLAPLAPHAVLVSADPAASATRAAHERMMLAGFAEVSVLASASQVAAA